MDENVVQYVWQHRLYSAECLITLDGQPVEVLYQGDLNRNAGPDFFNARLRIGDTLWAGNVEVHTRSDDWYAHGHHTDSAYNNVILHVVAQQGRQAQTQHGESVATCVIDIPTKLRDSYQQFIGSGSLYPCRSHIRRLGPFEVSLWMQKLIADRMEQKYLQVQELLQQTANNWETVYYILIAQAFGGTVNKTSFGVLAQNMPLSIIAKHKQDIFQLEALLFGTANLLESGVHEYSDRLLTEYRFLAKKYSLSPIPRDIWRFARMRPVNSPYIRIAELAMLLCRSSKLFSKTIQTDTTEAVRQMFCIESSKFWDTHYSFSSASEPQPKRTGHQFIDSIIINAVVPLIFSYSSYTQNENLQERSILLLESLPPEQNSILDTWKNFGIKAQSACETQALLQLDSHFCKHTKCIQCAIGNKLIRESGLSSIEAVHEEQIPLK